MINVNDKVAWGIREIENKIAQTMYAGINHVMFNMNDYMVGDDEEKIATKMLDEVKEAGFEWEWEWFSENNYLIMISW